MPTLGFKSVHNKLSREDLSFANELGWLTALAFAVITVTSLVIE